MRNVLVGALCAVGLFMFFYRGYDKYDNLAGNIAGFCAIGVAWFPTTEGCSSNWVGVFHYVFAAIFFVILAIFSLFLFIKTDKEKHQILKRKEIRNMIYRFCGIIIVICILAITVFINIVHTDCSRVTFIFWAETIALIAFGFSWLTKGGMIFKDK